MSFVLHYGPARFDLLAPDLQDLVKDHPFSRMMPDEVTEQIDTWVATEKTLHLVLVEEYPIIYMRYLLRKGVLKPGELHILWHDEDDSHEIRMGSDGEFLDPWPGGFFDRSLEYTLGGWE